MARQTLNATIAALVIAAAAPRATVLVPAGFDELAREALTIVHGRVIDVRGQWTDTRRRGIETVVTLEVRSALKGDPGSTVTVRVPGGEMGRYRSIVIGAPRFQEGEEVILFLGGRAPALPHLLGFGQGVYRVVREAGTGRRVVTPPAMAGQAEGPIARGDAARRPLGLDEFARQVRQAAGAARDRDTVPGDRVRRVR